MNLSLTFRRLSIRGIRFYWRTSLSVDIGVALAAAVLAGALIVGDSVRFSLRSLALMRLGDVSAAMSLGDRFSSTRLAPALESELRVPVESVLRMRCSVAVETPDGELRSRINRAIVLGVTPGFWRFAQTGADGPAQAGAVPGDRDAAVSESVAAALGLKVGDAIVLRVEKPELLPRSAPLASRKGRPYVRVALSVARVVPDGELGRFNLEATQIAPFNVFVSIAALQRVLDLSDRGNLLLIGGGDALADPVGKAAVALRKCWKPADAGLRITRDGQGSVLQLESDRVFMDPGVGRAALEAGGPKAAAGTLTYLVNGIAGESDGQHLSVPYSFVMAADAAHGSSVSPVPEGLGADQIVLNQWLADKLKAKSGGIVTMDYFVLPSSGSLVRTNRSFRIHSIVPMDGLEMERRLAPAFPGLTDVESCGDWDIGLPLDEASLRDKDNEAYWAAYRQTPKAFVTLGAGREMWGNRFGDLTTVRYDGTALDADGLAERLGRLLDPASLGFFFTPVRAQAMDAVAQAQDMGQLFLGMSFFLIVSALMLAGLLYALGVQQRAADAGTLLAMGFRWPLIRRLLLMEGAWMAAAGAAIGALAGWGYARWLIWNLGHGWKGAVAGAALRFHAEPASFFLGAAGGFAASMIAMFLALRRLSRYSATALMSSAGMEDGPVRRASGPASRLRWAAIAAATGGAVALVLWAGMSKDASVEVFFGAGALLLAAGVTFVWQAVRKAGERSAILSIFALGAANAARRTWRSVAMAGLLASGTFLVLAVSAMKEDPSRHAGERWSGAGGFGLLVETSLPVLDPIESAKGRAVFGLDRDRVLAGVSLVQVKKREGDDASCLNLNRSLSPPLLGVEPRDFSSRGAFAPKGGGESPWTLLDQPLPPGVVPGLAGDMTTLQWGLRKKADPRDGSELACVDERGIPFKVRLVGVLPERSTVFQGSVLIPARDFNERYPSEDGWRLFLADVPDGKSEQVRAALSARLANRGGDVTHTTDRLKALAEVEATYLAMFLVLGGLGMILGAAGTVVVVARNIAERRGELALLHALGFTRRQVERVVLAEHWLAAGLGLGVGIASAAWAVWPTVAAAGAEMPWGTMALLVGALAAAVLGGTALAVRVLLRGSPVPALRNE